jgi:hypothetical protein
VNFCSEQHRRQYQQDFGRLAMNSLLARREAEERLQEIQRRGPLPKLLDLPAPEFHEDADSLGGGQASRRQTGFTLLAPAPTCGNSVCFRNRQEFPLQEFRRSSGPQPRNWVVPDQACKRPVGDREAFQLSSSGDVPLENTQATGVVPRPAGMVKRVVMRLYAPASRPARMVGSIHFRRQVALPGLKTVAGRPLLQSALRMDATAGIPACVPASAVRAAVAMEWVAGGAFRRQVALPGSMTVAGGGPMLQSGVRMEAAAGIFACMPMPETQPAVAMEWACGGPFLPARITEALPALRPGCAGPVELGGRFFGMEGTTVLDSCPAITSVPPRHPEHRRVQVHAPGGCGCVESPGPEAERPIRLLANAKPLPTQRTSAAKKLPESGLTPSSAEALGPLEQESAWLRLGPDRPPGGCLPLMAFPGAAIFMDVDLEDVNLACFGPTCRIASAPRASRETEDECQVIMRPPDLAGLVQLGGAHFRNAGGKTWSGSTEAPPRASIYAPRLRFWPMRPLLSFGPQPAREMLAESVAGNSEWRRRTA